jgi:uncharacterized RDD family membrane protein YckC
MKRYQTFWLRLGALFLDGVIFLPMSMLVPYLTGIDPSTSLSWLIFINLISFAYSICSHGLYGYTIGKKLMNIQVVSHQDETKLIGINNSIKREAIGIALFIVELSFRIVSSSPELLGTVVMITSFGWFAAELTTMFLNEKRRSVHDLLAGSVVINLSVKQ